jgi:hypothetical protein
LERTREREEEDKAEQEAASRTMAAAMQKLRGA